MNAMEGRRVRRLGRFERERRRRAVIPLQRDSTITSSLSRTDCCYCDYKISALNQPLFRLGTRFAAFLRPWFSLGIGFALASLLSVSLIILFQLAVALRILRPNPSADLLASFLFGFSPVSAFGISLSDSAYLLLSTLISVAFHEFGHALAAASMKFWILMFGMVGTTSMESSEGVQMDYVAVFLVFLFPGALVAFNYDALQALSPRASLRVYCAGIWHNAVCCLVCCLVLILLPVLLFPCYQQGQSPMVLSVPSSSPLSPYLTPGDAIVSLDEIHINSANEWMEMAALLNQIALEDTNNGTYVEGVRKISSRRYCVPDSMLAESKNITIAANQSGCVDELAPFFTVPCSDTKIVEHTHCLNPKRVVKLAKCSSNWMKTEFEDDSCKCSQDETCLSPIQTPGMIWVEVSYSSPNSPKCLQSGRQPLPDLRATSDIKESDCGGTFIFVGDLISMASSIQLTSYRPRWEYASTYLPHVVEKILICTFHVSLTLALLNSLPVYFLDGESILEETLCYLTRLSPNKREKLLQMCLLVGTLISLLTVFRIFFLRFL